MMAYLEVPFGGVKSSKQDDGLKLGFTVEQNFGTQNFGNQHFGNQEITNLDYLNDTPYQLSLINIEYSAKTNYFSIFKVGGVDALTYEYVMNADGTATQWPLGLSTQQIVLGALAGAAVGFAIHKATDDDDDGEDEITCVPPLVKNPFGPGCI